ncbi:cohesin domain-containing protein [Desulfobacterales bacterium HSG16]|nr:cohesin domain-containing protein [Desulfobacterales bacterium HSG16]
MLIKTRYLSSLLIAAFFLTCTGEKSAIASPVVSLPQYLEVTAGSPVEVPITLSGTSDVTIAGFFFRLDYDQKILLNPEIVKDGTISKDLNPEYRINPADLIGKLSAGVISGLSMTLTGENVTLIKIKFEVSNDFTSENTEITFARPNDKSVLFTSSYDLVEASFINGKIQAVDISPTLPEIPEPQPIPQPVPTPPPTPPPTPEPPAVIENNPDFNQDGSIDIFDLQAFGDHWLLKCGDVGWDSKFDLVLDCKINAADRDKFAEHWVDGAGK